MGLLFFPIVVKILEGSLDAKIKKPFSRSSRSSQKAGVIQPESNQAPNIVFALQVPLTISERESLGPDGLVLTPIYLTNRRVDGKVTTWKAVSKLKQHLLRIKSSISEGPDGNTFNTKPLGSNSMTP